VAPRFTEVTVGFVRLKREASRSPGTVRAPTA
jgi:hypothetical protein